MEHRSIDPILWDVAKYIVDNGDESFDYLQSAFGIDAERADILVDYLWTAGIVTMTTFGPRSNYFNEDDLWQRYSLIDFIYNKRTEIKSISPDADILDKGRIIEAGAKIDGYDCRFTQISASKKQAKKQAAFKTLNYILEHYDSSNKEVLQ